MKDIDMAECVDERDFFEITKGFWCGHIFVPRSGTSRLKVDSGEYNSADLRVYICEIFESLCGQHELNKLEAWELNRNHGEFLLNSLRRHITDGESLDVAFGYRENIKKGNARWSSVLEIGFCAIPFLIMQERIVEGRISGSNNVKIQLKSLIPDAFFAVKTNKYKLMSEHIEAYESLTEAALRKKFTKHRAYLQRVWDTA